MLKNNFCSSPWFHIKMNSAGYYIPCRWTSSLAETTPYNVADTTISEYMNSETMRDIRTQLLNGEPAKICSSCYYEDEHNKLSGRKRQLLKSVIDINNFDNTFCASPHWPLFQHSHANNGHTNYLPVDLQIDLGNTCNSACIMCVPEASSKLALDYRKLIKIEPELFGSRLEFNSWADDDKLIDKFVNELAQIPNIRYIHFLGGETLYLKSFYTICDRLIELGVSKDIIIGTTTNGTIYTPKIEHIIKNFKQVHLGVSIETATRLNDYIRWPGDITQILGNIKKFAGLRHESNLHLSLRITPTIFSVYHLDTLFEFMIENKIMAESCNIMHDPSCLRIELLPNQLIQAVLAKIETLINKYSITANNRLTINRRRDDIVDTVIADIINEYYTFLKTFQVPEDVEVERTNLVKFIRAFESLRNNKILDYLPEYEEFLRSYGY